MATRDEFSAGMNKDALALYQEALELGWVPRRVSSNGNVLMDHPNGMTASLAQGMEMRNRAYQNAKSQIARATKVEYAEALHDGLPDPGGYSLDHDEITMESWPKELRRKVTHAEDKRRTNGRTPGSSRQPEVIELGPWIAKSHMGPLGGVVYPSAAVLAAKWNDGSTEYLCADPECDYANPLPRSVTAHYGAKHGKTKPATGAREARYLDVSRSWEPTPHQASIIKRLSREIDEAMEWGAITPEEIAEAIVRLRGEHAPDEQVVTRELTSDEVLDRIRALVSAPEVESMRKEVLALMASSQEREEQLAEIQERYELEVAGLTERVRKVEVDAAEAEVKAEEAQATATRYKDRWVSLTALIGQEAD